MSSPKVKHCELGNFGVDQFWSFCPKKGFVSLTGLVQIPKERHSYYFPAVEQDKVLTFQLQVELVYISDTIKPKRTKFDLLLVCVMKLSTSQIIFFLDLICIVQCLKHIQCQVFTLWSVFQYRSTILGMHNTLYGVHVSLAYALISLPYFSWSIDIVKFSSLNPFLSNMSFWPMSYILNLIFMVHWLRSNFHD